MDSDEVVVTETAPDSELSSDSGEEAIVESRIPEKLINRNILWPSRLDKQINQAV